MPMNMQDWCTRTFGQRGCHSSNCRKNSGYGGIILHNLGSYQHADNCVRREVADSDLSLCGGIAEYRDLSFLVVKYGHLDVVEEDSG